LINIIISFEAINYQQQQKKTPEETMGMNMLETKKEKKRKAADGFGDVINCGSHRHTRDGCAVKS